MYDGCPKDKALSLSHCEELRDWMRQEDMGRVESKRHFKEMVTRFGDSLESGEGVKGKGIFPARERGSVQRELCARIQPHIHCSPRHVP